MDHREVAVTQITSPDAASEADPGRRERKKQRHRDALCEAAMELFSAKGYDRTAVHEITDAVDVSERTFFRYFASKEDLVLSFIRDGAAAFAAALAARPAEGEPLTGGRPGGSELDPRAARRRRKPGRLPGGHAADWPPAVAAGRLPALGPRPRR